MLNAILKTSDIYTLLFGRFRLHVKEGVTKKLNVGVFKSESVLSVRPNSMLSGLWGQWMERADTRNTSASKNSNFEFFWPPLKPCHALCRYSWKCAWEKQLLKCISRTEAIFGTVSFPNVFPKETMDPTNPSFFAPLIAIYPVIFLFHQHIFWTTFLSIYYP